MSLSFSNWIVIQEDADQHQWWYFCEQFANYFLPLLRGEQPIFEVEAPDPCRDALAKDQRKLPEEIADKIHRAAMIYRAKSLYDAGIDPSEAGIDVSPEEAEQKADKAWKYLDKTLYPLILRFVCNRGYGNFEREPNLRSELASELWMAMMDYLQKPKKTKFPDDFVGYVAASAGRQVLKWAQSKRRALSPANFTVDPEAEAAKSAIARLRKMLKKAKADGDEATAAQIQREIENQKQIVRSKGTMDPTVVHGGGDPGQIGQYSGVRRYGTSIGGDENAAAAAAIQAAVTSGGDLGDLPSHSGAEGVGEERPGAGRQREEIPGRTDVRDFNWELLHRAISDLANHWNNTMPVKLENGERVPANYAGLTIGQLAALAWQVRFGLDNSAVGASMKNLSARSDYLRQHGKLKRDDKYRRTWVLPGGGSISEYGATAKQMQGILSYVAQQRGLPEPDELKATTVKNWIERSRPFLMNWLLPPEERTDPEFKRPSDPDDVGSVDYRRAGVPAGRFKDE